MAPVVDVVCVSVDSPARHHDVVDGGQTVDVDSRLQTTS